MKIKMGVLGRNASGEPDVFAIEVECTDAEYVDGHHYDFAMSQADANGFKPAMAFDENDPAWTAMASRTRPPEKVSGFGVAAIAREIWGNPIPKEAYVFAEKLQGEMTKGASDREGHAEGALRNILDRLRHSFGPEDGSGGVSGADFMEAVAAVCQEEFDGRLAEFKFAVGYGSSGFAYGGDVLAPVFDHARIKSLEESSNGAVIHLPFPAVFGSFPTHDDLIDTAESALARGEKYGFTIGAENAAEVIREELALCGFDDLTPEFDPICVKAMMTVVERERSAARERGGA